MSIKALRSRLSDIALRILGLSKGGALRLTSRLRAVFDITISQIACGAWFLMSFICGIVTPLSRSPFPAIKARVRVDRFLMIVYSLPSRYGRPFFQYAGFRV